MNLHKQLQGIIKERDDVQAKLLVVEQIVQNYKRNEQESNEESNHTKMELIDQLNRKEYWLQMIERQYCHALDELKKLSSSDPAIYQVFHKLKFNYNTDCKVSNVVELNNVLKAKLAAEEKKVKMLKTQMSEFTSTATLPQKEDQIDDFMIVTTEESHPLRLQQIENKENLKDNQCIEEYKEVDNENTKKLREKINELYKVNTKLTEALKEATSKISSLKRSQFSNFEQRKNKTQNFLKTLV